MHPGNMIVISDYIVIVRFLFSLPWHTKFKIHRQTKSLYRGTNSAPFGCSFLCTKSRGRSKPNPSAFRPNPACARVRTHSHTHLDEFYCIFPNMILLLKNSNNFHHFHNHTLLATLERTRQRSSYTAMNKCLRTSVIVCISCRK